MSRGNNYAARSDSGRNPYLSRRWIESPHCDDFQAVGSAAADIVADLQFRRQVERVHALGARVCGDLLAEIGAERSIMTLIDQKLTTYGQLDPKALEAMGGDRFWPAPLHEVRR